MIRFPKLCDLSNYLNVNPTGSSPPHFVIYGWWTLLTISTRTLPVPAHHDPFCQHDIQRRDKKKKKRIHHHSIPEPPTGCNW
jgi:hypothetical protein